jgi:hypothetical protein
MFEYLIRQLTFEVVDRLQMLSNAKQYRHSMYSWGRQYIIP